MIHSHKIQGDQVSKETGWLKFTGYWVIHSYSIQSDLVTWYRVIIFWPNILLYPNFLYPQWFLGPHFFNTKCIGLIPNLFLASIFVKPKNCLEQKNLLIQILFEAKCYRPKEHFTQVFFTQNNFDPQIVWNTNVFGPPLFGSTCFGPTFIWTPKKLSHLIYLTIFCPTKNVFGPKINVS